MLRCRSASAPLVAGSVAALVLAASGIASAEPRALLELFTSQGCSSCPAADKLLGELANDSSVVALSVPIDYWDYLGWKDTLASPAHSARQRAYAHVRGDRQVYTPQVVVNGAMHVLGSDRSAIDRMIVQTDQKPAVMSLPVQLAVNGSNLAVTVKAKDGDHTAGEVWLCPVSHTVQVDIGRGENRGRTITYHNVVRGWVKLGDWSATDATWTVPLSEIKTDNADAAAVLVQEGTQDKPGVILGAAFTPIAPEPTEQRKPTASGQ
jgi:hypothetical protein